MSASPTVAHSFRRRFAYKLAANLIGVFLSFFQAGLVSRALGPRAYGNYHFLVTFFHQFISLLDMRSSTWLYTSLSSRREKSTAAFYVYLALLMSLVTIFFPLAVIAIGLQHLLWPDQAGPVIVMVAALCLVLWYSDLLTKVCDAFGLTVSLEKLRVVHALLFFAALALLIGWTQLDVSLYLGFQLVATIALIAALMFVLHRSTALRGQSFRPADVAIKQNSSEVFDYSHPLFVYTLTGLLVVYADRWVLQRFGGSLEQGLFSLAYNISIAFNVFVNALHPLVMREFAVAFAENDLKRARDIFKTLIPACYILLAFGLCFAAVYADGCVRIIGGSSYQGAASAFRVMALLPIIQTYSFLSGSLFYATNQTRRLRNIGLVLMPLSIAGTFLMIGPKEYGGLQLGAVGLAVKLVVLELIGNNIVLYYNARTLNLRFHTYLLRQISVVAVFMAIAFGSRAVSGLVLPDHADGWLYNMIGGGLLYVATCFCVFHFVPSVIGIDKERAAAFLKEALANAKIAWVGNAPDP